ncbi:hypothetical protein JM79_2100 [Gramella sp. Hel_I_59]|uniref:hypothetical protein n=1 Tax=Gramella sp. Hel_I_59 TaxID=1249978 RepID=UPI00114FEDB3|nr:hypothetical protein [Gramella sp. Hel_I_59]TQI71173.1 hypothetical protein JM79_2100 [Gramella sp. Hel_I_59]
MSCSSLEKKSKTNENTNRKEVHPYKVLINDFEKNKLHKIYPNLETSKAYHRLLKDILDRKIEISDLKTKMGKTLFQNTLKKELQCSTDSVWIDENLSIVHLKEKCWDYSTQNYKYKNSDFGYFKPGMDKDSIVKSFKNKISFNYYSNYINELKSHDPKSDFLNDYIYLKEAAGDIAFYIIAENMIKANVSFNQQIIKRIFITEIVYN